MATLTSPLNFLVSNILAGNNITIDLTNHAGKLGAIRIHASGGSGDAGGTNARQFGTITLTNLSGTGAITNAISLSTSNATSKPLTNSFANGVLELFGLEGGANISLGVNGSNIVITATAGGGSTSLQTNANQFAPNLVLTIISGAFLTNMNYWLPGTNHGNLRVEGDLIVTAGDITAENIFPALDDNYIFGNSGAAWLSLFAKSGGLNIVESIGTDFVQFLSPSLAASYTLTLPNAQGANGTTITNNGAGALGWWDVATAIFGVRLTTNVNQFFGVPLSIKTGAALTNFNGWGSGTNMGDWYIGQNLFMDDGSGARQILFMSIPDLQIGHVDIDTLHLLSGVHDIHFDGTLPALHPAVDATNDLGLSTERWRDLWAIKGQFGGDVLRVPLVVTNLPGSTLDLATMLTTNAAGLRVTSNGAVVVRGVIGSTTNSFEVRRSNNTAAIFGITHSNTVRIVGPSQSGYGATLTIGSEDGSTQNNIELFAGSVFSGRWRSDNAGNQVISAGGTGSLDFNFDDGSGQVGFGLPGAGRVWHMIPSSDVAAFHGGTTRRAQITNVWDVFVRSNVTWIEVGGSDVVSLQSTSSMSSYTMFLPITNGLAGQVLYNVGGGALSWKDDATGTGGAGLTTNANQFGESAQLTIKSGVKLTNILAFELANSAAALVITQHIGSATNALEIVSSNKEPVIVVTSNSTFFVKGVTGRTNDGFVVARTNGTATLMVRSNDVTVATNLVIYPLGDEVGVPYRLFNMTNSSILTNKTTSANIISNYSGRINLQANFWTPGKRVQLKFRGSYFSPAGTFTWTNAVFFGSTMIASNLVPLAASVAGDVWEEEIDIVCRNEGASGTLVCHGMCVIPSAAAGTSAVGRRVRMASGAVTVDTTAAADLSVTFHPSATTRALEIYVGHGTVYP